MTDFLSDHLVHAKRFGIDKDGEAPAANGDRPQTAAAEEQPQESKPPPDPEPIVRKEQQASTDQAFRQSASELLRQRREMLLRLDEHIGAVQHEQDSLAAHLEGIERLRKELAETPEDVADDDPSSLRTIRRMVEAARLELARDARAEAERVARATCGPTFAPASSPLKLLWTGFLFGLPIIVALLASALIVALTLIMTFGV